MTNVRLDLCETWYPHEGQEHFYLVSPPETEGSELERVLREYMTKHNRLEGKHFYFDILKGWSVGIRVFPKADYERYDKRSNCEANIDVIALGLIDREGLAMLQQYTLLDFVRLADLRLALRSKHPHRRKTTT